MGTVAIVCCNFESKLRNISTVQLRHAWFCSLLREEVQTGKDRNRPTWKLHFMWTSWPQSIFTSPYNLYFLCTYQCKPRGGGGGEFVQGVGIWQILNFFYQIPQGEKRKVNQKCEKSPHPRGKNLNKQYYNTKYKKRIKEHFKSTFLLLLLKVNVSSVKLLAVIKYFLSPLASLILNNKITPGRLTVLL